MWKLAIYNTIVLQDLVRLLKGKKDSKKKFLEELLKNKQFIHDLITMKKISSIRRNFEEIIERLAATHDQF